MRKLNLTLISRVRDYLINKLVVWVGEQPMFEGYVCEKEKNKWN